MPRGWTLHESNLIDASGVDVTQGTRGLSEASHAMVHLLLPAPSKARLLLLSLDAVSMTTEDTPTDD